MDEKVLLRLALGRAMRELRARRGVSQEQLGFDAGLHRNYIGAMERGENNPSVGALERAAAGLRVTVAELFALRDERLPELRAQLAAGRPLHGRGLVGDSRRRR